MPGPVPKRTDARRRRNIPDGVLVAKAPGADHVVWPEPFPTWGEIAKYWYLSLQQSGQSRFYEPSDVAEAIVVAEVLDRLMRQGGRISSQLLAQVLAGMTDLLTSEGSRRRARIELERKPAESSADSPKVTAMDKYRRAAER